MTKKKVFAIIIFVKYINYDGNEITVSMANDDNIKSFIQNMFTPIDKVNVGYYERDLQKAYLLSFRDYSKKKDYDLQLLYVKNKAIKVLRNDKTGEHKIII